METNDWNDAERRVERAAELFEQRKWSEALEELRLAVTINPYNAAWLFNLGITLDELGRCNEAVHAYRQALELEPGDVATLSRLGGDLQRLNRFREAIDAFEQITRIQNDAEYAYCPLIACYAELGDHEQAEQAFYMARQLVEHCPACYFNIGCSLLTRGQLDRAIYCLQQTIDLQPAHPQVVSKLAEAYWRHGELERARRWYLARLRQAPLDVAALLDLSELLLQMGRVVEAGERIAAAAQIAPQNPAVHFTRAMWHQRRRQPHQAIESLQSVLHLDPTYPAAHLRLGEIRLSLGQVIEARTHLRSEVLRQPHDPRTLHDLANLLLDTGETRSAVTCLRRLTALRPDDLAAWQNLAVALLVRGQLEDGIATCRRALALRPDHPPVVFNLGLALAQAGRSDEAARVVRSARLAAGNNADLELLAFRIHVMRWKSRFARLVRRFFHAG